MEFDSSEYADWFVTRDWVPFTTVQLGTVDLSDAFRYSNAKNTKPSLESFTVITIVCGISVVEFDFDPRVREEAQFLDFVADRIVDSWIGEEHK